MRISRKGNRYGWIPDIPDHRDALFAPHPAQLADLPASVDLRPVCPPVYEQGELGSCTANAIAGAFEFEQMKQNAAKDFLPSRLFVYYNERVLEHTTSVDSGAQLRDGLKSVAKQGVCPEDAWPYNIARFRDCPPDMAYALAGTHKVTLYSRVPQDLASMKACLAAGRPFVCGITVYTSFESPDAAKTGRITMPQLFEHRLGGHAVMIVGYDDALGAFKLRNSWGRLWAQDGYADIPFAYLTNAWLARDFWTISLVEGA